MWVEQLPNGKYRYGERFLNPLTGKRQKVSVTLEKNTRQARAMAEEMLRQKIAGYMAPAPAEIHLSRLIDLYIAEQHRTVKPSTLRRNEYALKSLLAILGDVYADKLTAGYIRQQLLAQDEEPGTMNERLVRLKALLRWAYKNDYVTDIRYLDKLTPFADVPRRLKIEDKFLEADDLAELLDGMRQWRDLTAFLALSGLRFGEAAALLCSDVDLSERLIHVTKTYDTTNRVTTSPKTFTSTRDVYMQDELFALCKQLLAGRFIENNIVQIGDGNLFFANSKGEHISYPAYRKYLAIWSDKAIGRSITPHVLRHTHASLLMEAGVDIDTISDRLGHSDSKITREIYAHVTQRLTDKRSAELKDVHLIG